MKKALKRHDKPEAITTDGLRCYRAVMTELGNEKGRRSVARQITGWNQAVPVPTTLAGDVAIPANEDTTEIRICACQRSQSLRLRKP